MTTVGVLGSIHKFHKDLEYEYSLKDLREIIIDFRPDIICGEVRIKDWMRYKKDRGYEGYLGPMEYLELIIPLCEEKEIEFIPVDWFEDDLVQEGDFFFNKSEKEIDLYESKMSGIMKEYFLVGKQSELSFNSHEFNELVEKKQEIQRDFNPEFHNITWRIRNDLMIAKVRRTIRQNPDKRILCIVGAEHNYLYLKQLSQQKNIDLNFPIGKLL